MRISNPHPLILNPPPSVIPPSFAKGFNIGDYYIITTRGVRYGRPGLISGPSAKDSMTTPRFLLLFTVVCDCRYDFCCYTQ